MIFVGERCSHTVTQPAHHVRDCRQLKTAPYVPHMHESWPRPKAMRKDGFLDHVNLEAWLFFSSQTSHNPLTVCLEGYAWMASANASANAFCRYGTRSKTGPYWKVTAERFGTYMTIPVMSSLVDRGVGVEITPASEASRSGHKQAGWMLGSANTGRRYWQRSHGDERVLDPDGYRERVRQMWGERAPVYDLRNDFHPPLCDQLITLADLAPGAMQVLDVACGTGSVALSAAKVLGRDGVITAIDISEAMLAKAGLTGACSVM